LFWIGLDIIGGARDARGPGHATQAEDGNPFRIRIKPHFVNEAAFYRRAADAGDRNKEESPDILRLHVGGSDGLADSLFAECESGVNPVIIRFAPRFERICFYR
jgi:hypothetical protein